MTLSWSLFIRWQTMTLIRHLKGRLRWLENNAILPLCPNVAYSLRNHRLASVKAQLVPMRMTDDEFHREVIQSVHFWKFAEKGYDPTYSDILLDVLAA